LTRGTKARRGKCGSGRLERGVVRNIEFPVVGEPSHFHIGNVALDDRE
jgi:hypothetical protein